MGGMAEYVRTVTGSMRIDVDTDLAKADLGRFG
jgi:hypothetical protein